MSTDEIREVVAADWLATVQTAQREGFGYFDWLGCVDEINRSDSFAIVLRLLDPSAPRQSLLLRTHLPRNEPQLQTIRAVFAGAGWHEREAAELFGIEFVGGDRRRLLLSPEFEGTPLRKDEVLAARVAVGWPGAKEPGESKEPGKSGASPGRRRMVPPGVPDPAVWGGRSPSEPPAEPAEVAASAVGGRVRRRMR